MEQYKKELKKISAILENLYTTKFTSSDKEYNYTTIIRLKVFGITN